MDSGRLIFDPSSSSHPGHMLILGGSGSHSIFRGTRSVLVMEEGTNKRRPFFTSPEELLEEEYYDEQFPEKKRRLTPEQVHLLEKSFEAENKPESERKSKLAKKLGLQPRQVAVWFQNRRARWKTKQLERDFDSLKTAYDSLLADHDSLLKDNDGLHSQVAALTEKLQAKELAVTAGPSEEFGGEEQTPVKGKAEDHLSTGSGVVDGEGPHHQLAAVDSSSGADSCYFGRRESFRGGDCVVGPVNGAHSEDDGSDDGPGAMFGESHHAAAADNWWGVWS